MARDVSLNGVQSFGMIHQPSQAGDLSVLLQEIYLNLPGKKHLLSSFVSIIDFYHCYIQVLNIVIKAL